MSEGTQVTFLDPGEPLTFDLPRVIKLDQRAFSKHVGKLTALSLPALLKCFSNKKILKSFLE